jgi:hypothetical protein
MSIKRPQTAAEFAAAKELLAKKEAEHLEQKKVELARLLEKKPLLETRLASVRKRIAALEKELG